MARSILSRTASFLLTLSLGACCLAAKPPAIQAQQPTWDIPVWIDANFKPLDMAAIEAALGDWNAAAGGYVHFYVASESLKHPVDYSPVFPVLDRNAGSGLTINLEGAENPTILWHDKILAWVDAVGDANIHICLTRIKHDNFSLRGIVDHEIAHSLGLEHSDHAGNLMSKSGVEDQVMCIDNETLTRLFRLRHWIAAYKHPQC